MELSKETNANGKYHSEDPYFQASHFTPFDMLNMTKPPAKGVDGDWDRMFNLLKNIRQGHQYFTASEGAEDGRTILHYACIRKNKQAATETVHKIFEFCTQQHIEVQDHLDFVNKKDNDDNTALQLATKKKNKALIKLLIENGADINLLKKDTTKQAIYMIYDKLLINIFDQSLHLEKDDDDDELANESLWKVDCDFRPITGLHNSNSGYQCNPKKPLNQTRHLTWLLRRETASRAAVLQHPLVQIFLHIKGEKFAIFLYVSLLYHILWSVLSFVFIFCNTHILDSTNINHTVRKSNLTVLCQPFRIYESGTHEFNYNTYFYIMVLLHLMSFTKEIVALYSSPDRWYYWKQLENLGQWVVNFTLLVVWIVITAARPPKFSFEPYAHESLLEVKSSIWKIFLPLIYVAGIFASLLLIQGQLTKTELLGIYNEMLAKGFQNIMKFLLAFLPLLTAFLITFHILLPMKKEFLPSWGLGFTKLLSMMVGEIGYRDVFYGDDEAEIAFKNVLKLLFLVFVITVVILLHNLLIGMTVSDVQKLEKKAKVNHLARRLEDINLMENFIVHPWMIKVTLHLKLDYWYKRAFFVDKTDTQKVKRGIVKRNKRLDEYPIDLREALIQWDKAEKSKIDSTSNVRSTKV